MKVQNSRIYVFSFRTKHLLGNFLKKLILINLVFPSFEAFNLVKFSIDKYIFFDEDLRLKTITLMCIPNHQVFLRNEKATRKLLKNIVFDETNLYT